MFIELWMVGVQRIPHSNQDIQTNIESYHGALKRWFALDTKDLRGRRIDWLVWRLTTTIAHHYMHTLEMKIRGFIKNKLMEAIITWSEEKETFIPLNHVYQPTLESDGAWGVWSQRLPNVIYTVKFPFTKIFCYICEWALQGNMCKHQIVVILRCINISQKDIIHYCGTWYRSHPRGLVTCLWTHDIFQMIWSPMMMTKMNILKVMMGSWNLMGSRAWSKLISLWVPL